LDGIDSPTLLIAGGQDKGGDYSPLKPLVKKKVKCLILMGEAKCIIQDSLGDLVETVLVDSLSDAVKEAHTRSLPGDVVLLSPACASFDMFKDYNERGDRFIREVANL